MNTALIFSEPIASFRGSIELGERRGTFFPDNRSVADRFNEPAASALPKQAGLESRARRCGRFETSTCDRAFA